MFQNKDELSKEDYRPVSLLFHTPKMFERIAFNQMNLSFESNFLSLLTGFR